MHDLQIVLGLVAIGTVVAAFAQRLRVPAPSLLVLAGVAIGLIPGLPPVRVPPEVVSLVVLPPLLWQATDELPWRDLRVVWRQVAVLAVGLVLASAVAVAFVSAGVAAIPLSMGFVLGAVLASTDPVAVSALGRRLSLPSRIQALVQGESLFNDATSLVLFQIAVGVVVAGAAAGSASGILLHGVLAFVKLGGGGALAGAAVAAVVIPIRSRITDPVLESVVALITPYAAYLLGQGLGLSGVMAVIVAGLVIGTRRTRISTARSRLEVRSVYQTLIFLLENVVFSLIGLELPTLIRGLSHPARWPLAVLAVSAALLVTRIAWVFPLWAAVHWRRGTGRPTWTVPAVVSWAGTRGVVPLAATLSIPLTTASGAPLPQRDVVMVISVVVIAVSLIVQGLTLEPLVRRTSVARSSATARDEEARARLRLAEAGIARLDEIAAGQEVPDAVIDRLRRTLDTRARHARGRLDSDGSAPPDAGSERDVRDEIIAAENAELARLYADGAISDEIRRQLQRTLDLEQTRFTDER